MNKKNNIFKALSPCGCFSSFKDQESDFIKEFKYWFLILNKEQRFLGRCILILKTHKIDEIELTEEEMLEKHKIYCLWRRAISKAFNPDKINQAQLGNEEHIHKGHLHWHFIPRYRRPIYFNDIEFQSDNAESQKLIFSSVSEETVRSPRTREKIKAELLKYL